MNKNIKRKLSEAYAHIKPYIKDEMELKSMCKNCERYMGDNHDSNECYNIPCFQFYLAYVYLRWDTSYEGDY